LSMNCGFPLPYCFAAISLRFRSFLLGYCHDVIPILNVIIF
jgi:hypothetical protein